MGYQLFGSAHLISVAVTICIVIAGVMLICKRNMLLINALTATIFLSTGLRPAHLLNGAKRFLVIPDIF